MLPRRVFAIDWSGAKKFGRKIVVAEVDDTGLVELRDDWKSREAVADYLIEKFIEDMNFVVGFDFAFSFPNWYLREKGCQTAVEFWELVQQEGEKWVSRIYPPFFKQGKWVSRNSKFRKTEEEIKQHKSMNPETVFKLVGARQVGKSSITGMPILRKLRENGFNIWPFDPPKLPMVIEIYPRLFYGNKIKKNNPEHRWEFLKKYPELSEFDRMKAACSDDVFDAVVSAFALYKNSDKFAHIRHTDDNVAKREGHIWYPSDIS